MHFRLQDEYMQLQEELKGTIEESKLVQEKYRQLLDQARKDLAAKHAECEELRTQVSSIQPELSDDNFNEHASTGMSLSLESWHRGQ